MCNLTNDRTPSSMPSPADIDIHIESTQCTPQDRQIKIHKKLPDLGNLSIARNTPLTSKLLLDTFTIPLVHNNDTPATHGTQNRRSSVNRTPGSYHQHHHLINQHQLHQQHQTRIT